MKKMVSLVYLNSFFKKDFIIFFKALHCAASRGHLECMKILIEQCKTSVDIMDNNNCTPIFYAATLGQVNACNFLLKYGSNLHVQDCKGRT